MNKTLFLWQDKNSFYARMADDNGISTDQVFKKLSWKDKIARQLMIYSNQSIENFINIEWTNKLKEYDTVILQDSSLIPPVVKYIRSVNKNIRLIIWYWNPVAKTVSPKLFEGIDCELWSFDEQDCVAYGMNYNNQYHFRSIKEYSSINENDVIFIGTDKGRIKKLLNLKSKFNDLDITSYFHITSSGRYKKYNFRFNFQYKNRINYEEYLKLAGKSKAILDVISDNQVGLTIRPLEAMYLKKKLITTDKNIIHRDFYHPNNIFVLGMDNLSNLSHFIQEDYVEIPDDIKNKYDFPNWIKNFKREIR